MVPDSLLELLEALPDGVVVSTTDGTIAALNSQLCVLSGYTRDELMDAPIETLIPSRYRAEHVALRTAYVAEGGGLRLMSERLDIVMRRHDGEEVPVDIALSTLKLDDEPFVIATLRDASVRRRAEVLAEQEHLFQAALSEITGALLAGAAFNDTLRTIARHARALARVDLAMVALPAADKTSLVLQVVEGPGAEGLEGSVIPLDTSMAGAVMRDREPALLTDARTDPRMYRPPGWPDDLGPALFVPLHAGDEVLGSLAVVQRRDRDMFSVSDIVRMKTFAVHAAIALSDARAQERLQQLRVLEDRDRVAAELTDSAINRLSSVALGLHAMLTHDPPTASPETIWSAIDEVDAAIAAIRSAVLPRSS